MTPDERFDQLISASLEWEADRIAATQPSVRQATRRLAARLPRRPAIGEAAIGLRPRVGLAPRTAASLNALTLLLLLLLALAAVVYVGSQLTRQPAPLVDSRFGFAAACAAEPGTGLAFDEPGNRVVLAFAADGGLDSEAGFFSLYADGRLVQDISTPGEIRASTISGAQIAVRRLAPRGVDAMLQRVSDFGLTPGCRTFGTVEAGGTLHAWTDAGFTQASWGPSGPPTSRQLSAADEAALVQLIAELADPAPWLPADFWIERQERLLTPDHWLLTVLIRPTAHRPGDVLTVAGGHELDGRDERYSLITMPGGLEPVEWGTVLPETGAWPAGSIVRCGPVGAEEAMALEASLESLANGVGLGTDLEGDVYTEDLTRSVSFTNMPVYGAGFGCTELVADLRLAASPAPTLAPPEPQGDLAAVDPCTLIPASAVASLGADATETRGLHRLQVAGQLQLSLGVPARACIVFDSTSPVEWPPDIADPLPGLYLAIVTLYPGGLDDAQAGDVVNAAFGAGPTREPLGEHVVWVVGDCLAEPTPWACQAFAGLSGDRLLIFTFTGATLPPDPLATGPYNLIGDPVVSSELARAFVRSVLDGIAE